MIYMAYLYEDLDRKGMLRDEEEISSSSKRKFEVDSPEISVQPKASTKAEVRKRPKVSQKKVKTVVCLKCDQQGHSMRKCRSSNR